MSWSPLLDPAEPRVVAALDEILAALAAAGAVPVGPTGGPLTAGAAGWAVLCAYAGREEAADRHLDAAFAEVAEVEMGASLYGGFAGVGWADAHLHPDADSGEEVDEIVLELVSRVPWQGGFDLVSGLVGLGVYALERRPRAVGCLEAIAQRLDEVAAAGADGVWHTPAADLPAHQRERAPAGLHDLGVAHGVAGALAFLAGAIDAGVEVERCRRLLERAVPWLLARRLTDGMPAQLVAGEAPRASRLGWCYGDPGTAAALLLAANATGHEAWREAALTIARAAAARPFERSGVVDAMLCHGAAGLGHIFHLDMRRPGEGVGGFRAFDGERGWHDDAGLLAGAAGAGLALLAATGATEPRWDRMLLLSLR